MTDDPGTRRRVSATLLVPLISFLLCATASQVVAQGGHRTVVGLMPMSGSTTLTTRSGAIGTKIWIRTASLPARTDVQIMMGALRDGFEVIATRVTDEAGKIGGMDSLQVEVPDWVTPDRPYLLIVTDAEYRPLGSADMFHPTGQGGTLTRSGRITLQETSCPMLTGEADEIYFLMGSTSGLKSGDRVKLEGTVVESGPCGQGTAIQVKKVEPLPTP